MVYDLVIMLLEGIFVFLQMPQMIYHGNVFYFSFILCYFSANQLIEIEQQQRRSSFKKELLLPITRGEYFQSKMHYVTQFFFWQAGLMALASATGFFVLQTIKGEVYENITNSILHSIPMTITITISMLLFMYYFINRSWVRWVNIGVWIVLAGLLQKFQLWKNQKAAAILWIASVMLIILWGIHYLFADRMFSREDAI